MEELKAIIEQAREDLRAFHDELKKDRQPKVGDLLEVFVPHAMKTTKSLRYIMELFSWESHAAFVKKMEDKLMAEEENKSRLEGLSKKRMMSDQVFPINKRLRVNAKANDKDGMTTIRESIVAFTSIHKIEQNGALKNNQMLALLRQNDELRKDLVEIYCLLLSIFVDGFVRLQSYWDSATLKRLVGRRRCSVATSIFFYLMQLASMVVQFKTEVLEASVTASIGKYFEDKVLSPEPIKCMRALSHFLTREVEYHNPEHKKAFFRCVLWILARFTMTGNGQPGFGELQVYKPISHMMHIIFHAMRRFEGSEVIIREPVITEDSNPFCMNSAVANGLLEYAKGKDFRPERIQIFSDWIFKVFMCAGDEACQLDVAPFYDPTPVGAIDEISMTPFRDLCIHITYLGMGNLVNPPKPPKDGDDPILDQFTNDKVEGPVTDRELRLMMTVVTIFLLDLFVTIVTCGEMKRFMEDNVLYEPNIQLMSVKPGSIIFFAGEFFVVPIGFVAGEGGTFELIATENKPDKLLEAYFTSIAPEEDGVTYKALIYKSLKLLKEGKVLR